MSDSKGKGVANGANVIDLVSPEGTVDAGGAGGSLAPPTHESISSGSSSVVVCKTASRAPKLDSSEGTADASGADGLLALPTHESIFISSGGSSVAVYPGSSKENLCPEAPDRKCSVTKLLQTQAVLLAPRGARNHAALAKRAHAQSLRRPLGMGVRLQVAVGSRPVCRPT